MFKKVLIFIFLYFCVLSSSFAEVSVIKTERNILYDKINAATQEFVSNPNNLEAKEKLIKLLSVRSVHSAKSKKDFESSADDLRTILYLLKDSRNTEKYNEYKKKLDDTLTKLEYFPSNYDNMELAKNLYLEEKYFASAYEFEELILADYEADVCLSYMGKIATKLGQNKSAEEYYRKSLEKNPKNLDTLLNYANTCLKNNNREEAFDKYYELALSTDDKDILNQIIQTLEIQPESTRDTGVMETLALVYQKTGSIEKARTIYNTALKISPDDIFLKYAFGDFLYTTGAYQEALKLYDNILQENPYESQIRISKAKCLIKLDRNKEALKNFQIVLAIYPNSKQAQAGIYKILKGENLDDIAKQFYPTEDNYTPTPDLYYDLGEFFLNSNDNQNAIVFINKAIEKGYNKPSAYLNLYKVYSLTGNSAKTFELMDKAHKLFPNNEEVKEIYKAFNKDANGQKAQLALSYFEKNDWQKAITIYEQIEPKSAEIYLQLANCYKGLKQYKKAEELLKEALKLDSDNSDLYYNLALVYLDLTSPQTARNFLLKAIELDKNNLKAVKLLKYIAKQEINKVLDEAYDCYQNGKYSQAQEILTNAIKNYNSSAQLYYYRALVYEAQENYNEAVLDYYRVLNINPDYENVYFSLGMIFEKFNKEREALDAYENFLSKDPQDRELAKEAQKKVKILSEKYY